MFSLLSGWHNNPQFSEQPGSDGPAIADFAASCQASDGLLSPTTFLATSTEVPNPVSPITRVSKRPASPVGGSDSEDRPQIKIKLPAGRTLRPKRSATKAKGRG